MDDHDTGIPRPHGGEPSLRGDSPEQTTVEGELAEKARLLTAISRAQELFISGVDPREVHQQMLDVLVQATGSAFGFLDEVLADDDGKPFKRNLALSPISREADSRGLFRDLEAQGFEFRDLENLAGAPVLEGRTVIANDARRDPRSRGVPEGHPPIVRYLGVPLRDADELIGVVGLANRPDDYTEELAASIEPLARACARMIGADRAERQHRATVAALAASEERYRRIAENISDVVWIADLDFHATYVSPSIRRMIGDTPEEHLKRRVEEKFPPGALATLRAVFAEEMEREQDPSSDPGRTREVVVQHYHRDGSLIWVAMHVSFVRDDYGRPIAVQGVTRDISERKRLEGEQLQLRERLSQAVEIAHLGYWEYDVASDTFTFDDAFYRVFRTSAREVGGYTMSAMEYAERFLHPDDRAMVAHETRDAVETTDPTFSRQLEHRIVYADGTPGYIAVHYFVAKDEAGRTTRTFGVNQDITDRKLVEQALTESERKWRTILVDTPQIGLSLDPQARIVFANSHFLQLTGWAEHEVLGQDWFAMFIPGNIREEVRQVFLTVMAQRDTGGFSSFENEILTRTGELRTIAWSNVLTKDVNGAVVDVTCLGIDLTERLRAEEQSRRLAEIVDSSLSEVFVFDARTLHFRYANRGALRNLRYTLEDLSRMTPVDLKPEYSEEDFRAAIRPLLSGIKESLTFETIHRRADGSEYPAEVHLQLMESAGDPVFLAVIFDITERRAAEAALRESEERYRLLVENANELVLMAQDGKIVFVNRRAIAFLGYTPEELTGSSFADHIHPEDRDMVVQNHLRRIAGEVLPGTYPFRILHRSGETRWVEIGAVRVDWQGRPATLNFLLDVTERRRAEDAREVLQSQLLQAQKMESIGRLAGGVAHDFNNMLGVILARTEMLQADTPDGDPRSEDLEEIRKAAARSADLTRQLLAFARRQTIAPKVLDLNDTVEGMLKMLRRLIGEDVDLVWRPDADLWLVKMDPAQVDQVLANLCVNARDAISEAGVVTIETRNVEVTEAALSRHPDAVPGRYVALSVTDDGCGMDDRVLSHLFEPFFTTKERGKGTGLGLATVYGITRQNDGFIQVRSEVGEGACFTVYLPAHQGDDGMKAAPAPVEMPRARGETLLLVEDDPSILKVATRMLSRLGYTVMTASDPDQAASLAREHAGVVQLLITDVVMPQRSGKALADEIQALSPDVRVLFMSGYTADVIAHRGVLDEGVSFIQKPFSMHELATRTREILDRQA